MEANPIVHRTLGDLWMLLIQNVIPASFVVKYLLDSNIDSRHDEIVDALVNAGFSKDGNHVGFVLAEKARVEAENELVGMEVRQLKPSHGKVLMMINGEEVWVRPVFVNFTSPFCDGAVPYGGKFKGFYRNTLPTTKVKVRKSRV
jgi:hypothetical protein